MIHCFWIASGRSLLICGGCGSSASMDPMSTKPPTSGAIGCFIRYSKTFLSFSFEAHLSTCFSFSGCGAGFGGGGGGGAGGFGPGRRSDGTVPGRGPTGGPGGGPCTGPGSIQ